MSPGQLRRISGVVATIALLLAVAALAPAARAQDPLEVRARQAAALIAAEPKWPDDLFDASFLKQVPPDKLRAVGKDYFGKTGALADLQLTRKTGEYAAVYDMILEKNQVVAM